MQPVRPTFRIALWLMLLLSTAASGQAVDKLESVHLLSANVGWAATGSQVFWTADGGHQWKNITPKTTSPESIDCVFFLDETTGWVLLSRFAEPEPQFDLATTTSGGASWSVTRITIPNLHPESTVLAGDGRIDFVDTLHGWMNLGVVSSSNFRLGALFETQDGGKSWNWATDSPGVAGSIHFVSRKEGWLAGGPDNTQLYATRDGATSWQQVSLKAPPQAKSSIYPTYDLPVFTDTEHGFLPVTYSGSSEAPGLTLVLFTTRDGGKSWSAGSVLPNLKKLYEGGPIPTAVIDSNLLTAQASGRTLTLTTATSATDGATNHMVNLGAEIPFPNTAVLQLTFFDTNHGWTLASDGLLSTRDGGATWIDITPPQEKGAYVSAPPSRSGASGKPSPAAGTSMTIPGSALPLATRSDVSIHRGFDMCAAATAANMQTWWTYSPHYDTGIYIGGISRTCPQPNLTSAWVQAVEKQGWGLMPLWPGPQAPCACLPNTGTYPSCTLFPHKFSTTPATAQTQGAAEADSAAQAAANLGLTGQVVYYDLENYNSSYCGAAAASFVQGWVDRLRQRALEAGVYGSAADANHDWPSVPDDVWIAKYDSKATIWGLTPLCDVFSSSCTKWIKDQRIHQFMGGHPETWGGIKFNSIDSDIDDAVIVAGNGYKTYSYTFSNFDDPASTEGSYGQGINNSNQVVGYYLLVGFNGHGFLYSGGTFTGIDYPGQPTSGAITSLSDINTAGHIVGTYNNGNEFGFLDIAGKFTALNPPNTFDLEAYGINDSDQIVGGWNQSVGGNSIGTGFLYNAGQFQSTLYPNSDYSIPYGINGAGQIAGSYSAKSGVLYHGFLLQAGQFATVDYPGAAGTFLYGINNNGQILGAYIATLASYNSYFLYDENTGSFTQLPLYPGAQAGSTQMLKVNDLGNIVGSYVDQSGKTHGFLATAQ